ncbi:MAG: ribonuclease HII [Bacteroidia bacterium]
MLLLKHTEGILEAGCDEAGRGCLAGPVFAAAVILPDNFNCPELNDSKQISEKKRYELRTFIELNALSYGVAMVDNKEIDAINILNASFLAMHRAIEKLSPTPQALLIDGNRFKPYKEIPHHCIIKGDGKYLAIAAASILAKTYRDDFMLHIHQQYPQYKWDKNKGYPSPAHRNAIKEFGITEYHRLSYKLLPNQLSLEF